MATRKPSRRSIPVVVNLAAGGAADPTADSLEVEGGWEAAVPDVDVRVVTTQPARLAECLASILDEDPEVVAVAGGDGTHRTAAEMLAGGRTELVTIPTGTLNHFARRCGIGSVADAVRLFGAGTPQEIAVGVVDDRMFLNTAILGLYPAFVRRRDRYAHRLPRWLPRWLTAALAVAVTAAQGRPGRLTLETEAGREVVRTPMVWIGPGRRSFPLSHLGDPDGREVLEVAVLRRSGLFGMLVFLLRGLRRMLGADHPDRGRGVEIRHVRHVLIRASGPVDIALDGEPMRMETPLFIAAVPHALRVRVPER